MWHPGRWMTMLALVAGLAACASQTTVQSQWRDPNYRGGPVTSAVVMAVGGSMTERRIFEDTVAQKMNGLGVNTMPAYALIPPSATPLPEAALQRALTDSKAQAFVLIRLLPLKTGYQVVDQPVMPMMGPMWGWYGFYQGPWQVQTLQSYQLANTQTSLWDVASGRLLWSGDLQAFDPASIAASAASYTTALSGALQKADLLPAPKAQ